MTPGTTQITFDERLGRYEVAPPEPWSRQLTMDTIMSVKDLLGVRYTPAMEAAFPDVTPTFVPTGYLALFQLRMPNRKTKGGILLADETKDEERWRTQAALVRLLGPSCFRDRQTGAPWVEGPWYAPGDFVRIPMYGSDRFDVEFTDADGKREAVRFALVKEADITAVVVGDPLNVKNS